jgi:hypothetical protein
MSDADFLQYIGVASLMAGYFAIGTGSTANGSGLSLLGSALLAAWSVKVDAAGMFVLFSILCGLYATMIAEPVIRLWCEEAEK